MILGQTLISFAIFPDFIRSNFQNFSILAGHTPLVGVRSHTVWASKKFVSAALSWTQPNNYSIKVNISMHTDLRYFIFKAPWTDRDEMRLVSFFVYNSTILNLRSFFSFFFFIKRICAHKCIIKKLMCNCSNFHRKSQFAIVQKPNC